MTGRQLIVGTALVCVLAVSLPICAQQFEVGDVIVSGSIPAGGTQQFRAVIQWYGADGQLKGVLADSEFYGFFGRLAFSPQGILYAPSGSGIVRVSPSGQITQGPYGGSTYFALSFAEDGTLVAGFQTALSRFATSGAQLTSYTLPVTDGVISIDVAADQCTAYFVGPGVRRFDVCQGTQLPNSFPSGGGDFRLLPGGGLAIARNNGVEIYSAGGALLRTIGTLGGGAIALDVDGASIWVAMFGGSLAKFDIATGNQLLGPIPTGLGFNGLTVYGEPRAAFVNGPLAGVPVLSRWMLLVLFAALGGVAILRLRM